ncbi:MULTISPECIES: RNA polymerase sigma factor [Marinobacter]|uniref:RNA polymerase sigma factor n=2 Tax=Marinobacteraceae TaxID=2887365 RepID=UPI0009E05F02|nr:MULTISPECIES: RNA polymerase sigma factor [Marinobacter]AZR40466.1 ECF RNA polymerase sigma factor SigH [Marinobacter salarius]MCZ4287025.1 RNA polymerase sigma factor [Marinobacter salarius]MDM8181800.1 RNA polymerase sigma factor [Marinobacter salarius]RUT76721.1 RNA polymerase sigma factor [Marinobacter sp. NP-6]VVT13349.1 RNA polymerase sigma-70 factor, ECF subfamily [Marinobacter salarius]
MALIPFRRAAKPARFEQLVQPNLEAMYRFAFRLSGQQHDAEDLVQDVVVKLYPRLEELEGIEQLRPWLNRVLYRHFIDQVRRKGRRADRPVSDVVEPDQQASFLDSYASDVPELSEQISAERLKPVMDSVIQELSPELRTLMLLHDVDGWSQEEIACVLEIPVGTVKSRVHRCRASLKKKLLERPELFQQAGRVEQ